MQSFRVLGLGGFLNNWGVLLGKALVESDPSIKGIRFENSRIGPRLRAQGSRSRLLILSSQGFRNLLTYSCCYQEDTYTPTHTHTHIDDRR